MKVQFLFGHSNNDCESLLVYYVLQFYVVYKRMAYLDELFSSVWFKQLWLNEQSIIAFQMRNHVRVYFIASKFLYCSRFCGI